jgi:hydrogenase expression/formation protein HypE
MPDKRIQSGEANIKKLVKEIILPEISNQYADEMEDSAVLPFHKKTIVFSTDSFCEYPFVFPGGDIGKLAVAGTVNDILAQGGKPLYMSMTIVVEEGFLIDDLKKISMSVGLEAKNAGIKITCGDMKVVEKGRCSGVFVSASCIGEEAINTHKGLIIKNDTILVTGPVGCHGAAMEQARKKILPENTEIRSDCNSLSKLLVAFKEFPEEIKYMKDPTGGGLVGVLNELASDIVKEIKIDEENVPAKAWVKEISQISGQNYLNYSCEGNMIIIVNRNKANDILSFLRGNGFPGAAIIGFIN